MTRVIHVAGPLAMLTIALFFAATALVLGDPLLDLVREVLRRTRMSEHAVYA